MPVYGLKKVFFPVKEIMNAQDMLLTKYKMLACHIDKNSYIHLLSNSSWFSGYLYNLYVL